MSGLAAIDGGRAVERLPVPPEPEAAPLRNAPGSTPFTPTAGFGLKKSLRSPAEL
jgi:hypothetical protein